MKTIIVYESTHHQNTLKLGFASGIAFGKFYKQITDYAKSSLPESKKVFFIFTAGTITPRYTNEMSEIAESKNCEVLGFYGCKGYDTFGPFKLVGGISKGHPTQDEIKNAVDFYESISK